jgi:hypothetical protein
MSFSVINFIFVIMGLLYFYLFFNELFSLWIICFLSGYAKIGMNFYQIENEYGDVESSYGQRGKEYVKWAAQMALGLGAGVPWVMCKQSDAPDNIVKLLAYVLCA